MTLQRNDRLPRTRPTRGHRHQQPGVEARVNDQAWPGTLMVLGIFVLIISFWWVGSRTLVTYMELARWFALFAFVGNLLPYKRAGLRLGMERLEWFLFNLLAVGPLVLSFLLWVNLLFHAQERLAVTAFAGDIMELRSFWMVNDELPASTPVEAPSAEEPPVGPIGGHLIGTARGSLGYEVIPTYERISLREE